MSCTNGKITRTGLVFFCDADFSSCSRHDTMLFAKYLACPPREACVWPRGNFCDLGSFVHDQVQNGIEGRVFGWAQNVGALLCSQLPCRCTRSSRTSGFVISAPCPRRSMRWKTSVGRREPTARLATCGNKNFKETCSLACPMDFPHPRPSSR